MTLPVIEVQDLSKCYGQVWAVEGISFSVERGATCAILGANGAGKTTTLAMLLGLVLPTSGQIRILGEDLLTHRYRILPRINFSSPYVDLPQRLTVAENLTVYGRLYGVRRVKERIAQLGEHLDLSQLMKREYGTLSAGQKTRVSLAKALLNRPEVVLLDEPTASLDPDTADRIRSYLMAYQQESGATLVMASHNMTEVERISTDVIIMRAGRIVDRGRAAALIAKYGRSSMEEVFLDIARNGREPEEPPVRRVAG
jgi:ABC-2 type transport system ATP-binding protein